MQPKRLSGRNSDKRNTPQLLNKSDIEQNLSAQNKTEKKKKKRHNKENKVKILVRNYVFRCGAPFQPKKKKTSQVRSVLCINSQLKCITIACDLSR